MAYEIATATSAGAGGLAHYDLLDRIANFATTNAALVAAGQQWQILRYNTSIANRELILKGPGLSGTDQIFVGIRTYQNASADYYNLSVATFKGYVDANPFQNQPGASQICGVPAHNLTIGYWLRVTGQSINCALKVGTPVYECFQVGRMFQLDTPGQYPQPLIAAGMFGGEPAVRYSDTNHSMPWKGGRSNFQMHFNDGSWKQPSTYPWSNNRLANSIRDTGGQYHLTPVLLHDATPNVYGYLDGIYHITGFNNAVENTLVINGKNYVVIQDVYRTGFGDYFAMELS